MRILLLWCAVCIGTASFAQEEFRVSDIRLQGLQRVSSGTVFNLLPVQVGDTMGSVEVRELMRLLFASGYFNDIQMYRDEGVLIMRLTERPAIESITLEGNKVIKSEDLLQGLGEQGLREGEIFKQATLERIGLELERQYVVQGRYDAAIDTDVVELPRNRVDILINIDEGKNSGVKQINIVGNTVYKEHELLKQLKMQQPTLTNFLGGASKYSREKLQGDLEILEAYYQDRGYVEFRPLSTQVSITPDKQSVYVTINVREGDRYTVNEVKLIGDLSDIEPEAVERMFLVEKGQVFSRARVTATEERIVTAFGNSGYAFASATGVPEVRDDGTVDVRFVVDSGKRAYVRRISFAGNGVSQDTVLRREMRQMEGGWASTAQIERSKERLNQLGFFEQVNVETPEVPGTDDQIDVDFTVKEVPTGSVGANIGYSAFGALLGANYQQSNFAGTGNSVNLAGSWSEYSKVASFGLMQPYYTADGVSRGFNTFTRELNYDQRNILRFATNSYGVGVSYGFPISESRRLRLGLTMERTKILSRGSTSRPIQEFMDETGDTFLNYKLDLMWMKSSLNSGFLATAGVRQRLNATVAIPGSDLEFYRLSYDGQLYIPVFAPGYAVRLQSRVGYGNVYGDTKVYPFFEHYYAGGFGSVRGFERNSLGPRVKPTGGYARSNHPDGDPYGGNLLLEGTMELIFPMPFMESGGSFRPVAFFDIGNVFDTKCDILGTPTSTAAGSTEDSPTCFDFAFKELRMSLGLGLSMFTGFGPMTFSLSYPLNADEHDEVERFSFEVGTSF